MAVQRFRFAIAIASTFVVFITATGCSSTRPTPENGQSSIEIGVIAPLTGDSSDIGAQARGGALLAEENVNATNGLHGKTLHVVIEDSQGDAQRAVTVMRKLISVQRVAAIVGDFRSKSILAEAPLANDNRVVLVGPTTSAAAITAAGPYVNRLWPVDTFEAEKLADWAWANGIKAAAIIYINDDYGLGLRDAFSNKLKTLGGRITGVIGFGESESDFKPALAKLAGPKPDAIYVVGFYKNSAIAVREARESGITVKLLGTTACEDQKFLEIVGKAGEGFIYPIVTGFDPLDPTREAAVFIQDFKKKFGSEPNWAGAHYYDGVRLLAYLIDKAGNDGVAIQKALLETHDYRGVTGIVNFDSNGDVVGKPITIKTVSNGRFTKLQ